MGSFGEDLRAERLSRGIALEDITEVTKISQRHLVALEQETFPAASRRHPEQRDRARLCRSGGAGRAGLDRAILEGKRGPVSTADGRAAAGWRLLPTWARRASSGARPRSFACAGWARLLCWWWWPWRLSSRCATLASAPAGGPLCCPLHDVSAKAHALLVHWASLLIHIADGSRPLMAAPVNGSRRHPIRAPLSGRWSPFRAEPLPRTPAQLP